MPYFYIAISKEFVSIIATFFHVSKYYTMYSNFFITILLARYCNRSFLPYFQDYHSLGSSESQIKTCIFKITATNCTISYGKIHLKHTFTFSYDLVFEKSVNISLIHEEKLC